MPEHPKPSDKKPSPRREFLKIAGLSAGSAVAAGTAPLLAEDKMKMIGFRINSSRFRLS